MMSLLAVHSTTHITDITDMFAQLTSVSTCNGVTGPKITG